jgi:hypothetical protein
MMLQALGAIAEQGAGGFDPLAAVGWTHAFWAGDPSWTPPADGGEITSWRNAGTDGAALERGNNGPALYRQSYSLLNGRPAIEFGIGGNTHLALNSSAANYSQPNTVVAVVYAVDNGEYPTLTDHPTNSSSNRTLIRNNGSASASNNRAGTVSIYAGSSVETSEGTSGAYHLVVLLDGSSSEFTMDGNSTIDPGNVGTHGFGGQHVGGKQNQNKLSGAIAFFAVKNGALTSTEQSSLLAWSQDHYGTP